MQITIIGPDGMVGVDGKFRRVDLMGIDAGVRVVRFDTALGTGTIEFLEHVTVPVSVRDQVAEDLLWAAAREAGTPEDKIDVPVQFKTVQVHKTPVAIDDFTPWQPFLDLYTSAEPTPPTATDLVKMQIAQEEMAAPFTQRAWREWFLGDAETAGVITAAILDPAIALDTSPASAFSSWPYMLQKAVLQERAVRTLRAQI